MNTNQCRSKTSLIPTVRRTATALIPVLLSLTAAACGSSNSSSSTIRASATPTTTTATTTSPASQASALDANKHPTTTPAKQHPTSASKQTATTTPTPSQTTTTAKSAPSSSPSHSNNAAPTVPPLTGPVVSGSAGGLRATLHGENHAPTINTNWDYSVLATDASGHPLTGTVDTEFTFNGQVVGHETPPTHPLSNGRLNDDLTFPAEAIGEPISVQVVVHTQLGTVTLDWPIKAQR